MDVDKGKQKGIPGKQLSEKLPPSTLHSKFNLFKNLSQNNNLPAP